MDILFSKDSAKKTVILSKETIKATNDSMPIIRRMPDVNE